ncbi:RNA polymerase sigma factor, sigma-70 family [Nakamurella panacisegetis]|uniref:RNA polymerase sigma factor, sigma-70 family n=1 Tax=Nakamurella panacisegetis TaxID=1090615 RepID=A0A1H0IZL1_9ACTN|nr:sigma-70 family RNA polymerase sigma factor [Nakamurella panacisegetis]SDO36947.1 RNA polymerase sigma factor, sigma-70 family [Nakamurella panacisegetis]
MATPTVPITDLVVRGARGDQEAWNSIVDRYLPLVTSVIRRCRVTEEDREDVSQTVWLRLVENLGRIRDPQALPAWIIRTTRNEALRVLRQRARAVPVDPIDGPDLDARPDPDEIDREILRQERAQALRDGLAELSVGQRNLLLLLVADPPLSYETISRRVGMPVGSIGPTRARYLAKLRSTPAVRALVSGPTQTRSAGNVS